MYRFFTLVMTKNSLSLPIEITPQWGSVHDSPENLA